DSNAAVPLRLDPRQSAPRSRVQLQSRGMGGLGRLLLPSTFRLDELNTLWGVEVGHI
ncbi:unnamed protein product, partial [Lampetra fluviatilis]